MEMFFENYFERLQSLHAEIEKAIEGLQPTALDWVPGADMNPMGVLVVHAIGAERFWIGDVALGDPSGRDRPAEFRTRGLEAEALIARLRGQNEYVRGALGRLSTSDLERTRLSPRDGKAYPLVWCLFHALDHTALHLGHVQMTRQLWDQKGAAT